MLPDDLNRDLDIMQSRVRRLLEQLSRHRVSHCFSGVCWWAPPADIQETQDAYHVFVDLAGVDPKSIKVVIDGNMLHLSGVRSRPEVADCIGVHQLEIDFGEFRRTFQFPANLDADASSSSYRHGLLEVLLPKRKVPSVQVPLRRD